MNLPRHRNWERGTGVDRIRASSDIAEAFNPHLTRISEDLANKIPNSDVDPLTYVKQSNISFIFREITINDILTLLWKIATNKATGLDKIPSKLLKIGGDTLAPSLTAILNRSLPTGIFHDWKKASVPLSRMVSSLSKYNLLSNCQAEFRSLHSAAWSQKKLVC